MSSHLITVARHSQNPTTRWVRPYTALVQGQAVSFSPSTAAPRTPIQGEPDFPSGVSKRRDNAMISLPLNKRRRVCISDDLARDRIWPVQAVLSPIRRALPNIITIDDSDSDEDQKQTRPAQASSSRRMGARSPQRIETIVIDSDSDEQYSQCYDSSSESASDTGSDSGSISFIQEVAPPSPPRISLPSPRRRRPITPDIEQLPPARLAFQRPEEDDFATDSESEPDIEAMEAERRVRLDAITSIRMTCPSALVGMFTDSSLKPCQPWRAVVLPTPPDSGASSPVKLAERTEGVWGAGRTE